MRGSNLRQGQLGCGNSMICFPRCLRGIFDIMPSEDGDENRELSEYEHLEHALWMALLCVCGCCHRCDEYPAPLESTDDPTEWAKIVAPLAQADGWTAPGLCFLLCPDCRANGMNWREKYVPPPGGGIRAADRERFQRWMDSRPEHPA